MAYELAPFFRDLPIAPSDDDLPPIDDSPEAIPLGRFYDLANRHPHPFLFNWKTSLLLFGPSGSGKGMRILAPILLQMHGERSVVVIDPKAELAALTAGFRRRVGRVIMFNPFNLYVDRPGFEDLKSEGYNPLLSLDHRSPNFNANVALLADALVPIVGKSEPYWDLSARALVAALIMWTVLEARGVVKPYVIDRFHIYRTVPTIARVRELLCQASGVDEDPLSKTKAKVPYGLPELAKKMMETEFPGLRNKAGAFTNWERDVQSVARTAMTHLEPFDDEPISQDLEGGNFDMRELKARPTTIYVILPPDQMERHAKWLRLVVSSALTTCMRDRRPGEPRVLFMLDEFYALGHLEAISKNWAVTRAYGVQLMPVLQNLGQLKKLYDDWEIFISSAGTTLWFTVADTESAEYLSKRCGDTTRQQRTGNSTSNETITENSGSKDGTNRSVSRSSGSSTSWSDAKVPAILPHKLFGLPVGALVMTLNGLANPVALYAPAHWQIVKCKERITRKNPYYDG